MNNSNYTDTRLARAMAEITADLTNEINRITAEAAKQLKDDMTALEKVRRKRNMMLGFGLGGILVAAIAAFII